MEMYLTKADYLKSYHRLIRPVLIKRTVFYLLFFMLFSYLFFLLNGEVLTYSLYLLIFTLAYFFILTKPILSNYKNLKVGLAYNQYPIGSITVGWDEEYLFQNDVKIKRNQIITTYKDQEYWLLILKNGKFHLFTAEVFSKVTGKR